MIVRVGMLGSHHIPEWRPPFEPVFTVMASGAGKLGSTGWVEEGEADVYPQPATENKPPYRIPLMSEINAIPFNGYTVASTFSGGGGSCLGYRWAGFKVLYANEFVPESRLTYAENFPDTYLDPADIRDVTGADLMARAGVQRGELDILDGSPPCQSFSTAGKRETGWGKAHAHGDGSKQVSDDLFFEYARILADVQPRTFVAENVSGLLKGTAKGYFKEILKALKSAGYQVEARLLDAQWLGVPQVRQRVIFVGVRSDLGLAPVHPKPLPYRYSLRDALAPEFDADGNVDYDYGQALPGVRPRRDDADKPVRSAMAAGMGGASSGQVTLVGRPADVDPETIPNDRYARRTLLDQPVPTVVSHGQDLIHVDPETGGSLVSLKDRGPGSDVILGVTHRRKFTLGELRRLCGFPDDYVLIGNYGQRWARLGNAVPPPMMRSVADTIRDDILRVVDARRS